jgi:hypothetical protein
LANRIASGAPLPLAVIVVVALIVVVFLGWLGWRTVGGSGGAERVPVDMNKVREQIKEHGFGHHEHPVPSAEQQH